MIWVNEPFQKNENILFHPVPSEKENEENFIWKRYKI